MLQRLDDAGCLRAPQDPNSAHPSSSGTGSWQWAKTVRAIMRRSLAALKAHGHSLPTWRPMSGLKAVMELQAVSTSLLICGFPTSDTKTSVGEDLLFWPLPASKDTGPWCQGTRLRPRRRWRKCCTPGSPRRVEAPWAYRGLDHTLCTRVTRIPSLIESMGVLHFGGVRPRGLPPMTVTSSSCSS